MKAIGLLLFFVVVIYLTFFLPHDGDNDPYAG